MTEEEYACVASRSKSWVETMQMFCFAIENTPLAIIKTESAVL